MQGKARRLQGVVDEILVAVERRELIAVETAVAAVDGCPPRGLRRGSCR
jgi:hypothetical protein